MKRYRIINALGLALLCASQASVALGADPLNASDQIRFGWFDVSARDASRHLVIVETKLCAAERGSKDVQCVALDAFKPVNISDSRTIPIRKNNAPIAAAEVNKKAAELTKDMKDPVIRVEFVLLEIRDDGSKVQLAHKYINFPPLTARPKPGDKVLQSKVLLESDIATAKVLAEVKR